MVILVTLFSVKCDYVLLSYYKFWTFYYIIKREDGEEEEEEEYFLPFPLPRFLFGAQAEMIFLSLIFSET